MLLMHGTYYYVGSQQNNPVVSDLFRGEIEEVEGELVGSMIDRLGPSELTDVVLVNEPFHFRFTKTYLSQTNERSGARYYNFPTKIEGLWIGSWDTGEPQGKNGLAVCVLAEANDPSLDWAEILEELRRGKYQVPTDFVEM